MNLLDKSNYFRGMLLLSGKDKKITQDEHNFIDKLGEKLGFEKAFTRTAINSFFQNEYIQNDPPEFSNPAIAKSFLTDGIQLIIGDEQINQNEIDWLTKVAEANGINDNWINELVDIKSSSTPNPKLTEISLSIENYL